VGLRYQNAKSVLMVAGAPLPVQMAGSRTRGRWRSASPRRSGRAAGDLGV